MSNDVRKVTDVIVGSEELGEKLQKIETVDELIDFYQSIDDSLTEDDILDYICEEIGIDDLENVDDLVLENVSGGKVDPKNKILSTALGALTAVSAIGAAPSVGAKDNNSSKTSVGQKIKGGFTKAGQAIKDKWNGLTKKQKIALVAGTTVAVAGAATIGGVLYHKHHKDKQDQKPADTVKPTVKLTDGNKKGDGPRKLAKIWGLTERGAEAPVNNKKLIDNIDELEAENAARKQYDQDLKKLDADIAKIKTEYKDAVNITNCRDLFQYGHRDVAKLAELRKAVDQTLAYQNSGLFNFRRVKLPERLNELDFSMNEDNLGLKPTPIKRAAKRAQDTSVLLSKEGRNKMAEIAAKRNKK